jgi:hypothetical protein
VIVDLRTQVERGCQLITVVAVEWGIEAARAALAAQSAVRPRALPAEP